MESPLLATPAIFLGKILTPRRREEDRGGRIPRKRILATKLFVPSADLLLYPISRLQKIPLSTSSIRFPTTHQFSEQGSPPLEKLLQSRPNQTLLRQEVGAQDWINLMEKKRSSRTLCKRLRRWIDKSNVYLKSAKYIPLNIYLKVVSCPYLHWPSNSIEDPVKLQA